MVSVAISNAKAIGKSNPVPALRMSAGARLTVISRIGIS